MQLKLIGLVHAANNSIATNSGKWGSIALSGEPVSHGKLIFCLRVLSHTGVAGCMIGIADYDRFNFSTQYVGGNRISWGYSMTGEKSAGSGTYEPYASKYLDGW